MLRISQRVYSSSQHSHLPQPSTQSQRLVRSTAACVVTGSAKVATVSVASLKTWVTATAMVSGGGFSSGGSSNVYAFAAARLAICLARAAYWSVWSVSA